jgi:hypothetical protein
LDIAVRSGNAAMASVETVVFQRIAPALIALIQAGDWERFRRGAAPLPPGNRRVDLLLLTLRDGVCEEIDPITLDLDANGYLMRIDVGMQPLPEHPALLDARGAFLGRYLQHANHWKPSAQLIDQALGFARHV